MQQTNTAASSYPAAKQLPPLLCHPTAVLHGKVMAHKEDKLPGQSNNAHHQTEPGGTRMNLHSVGVGTICYEKRREGNNEIPGGSCRTHAEVKG